MQSTCVAVNQISVQCVRSTAASLSPDRCEQCGMVSCVCCTIWQCRYLFFFAGELDISVWPVSPISGKADVTIDPFLRHAFPSISSVGRRNQSPRYVAYIVGNNSCNIANAFTAHVFLCISPKEASRLTTGISNGFKRTNWAM